MAPEHTSSPVDEHERGRQAGDHRIERCITIGIDEAVQVDLEHRDPATDLRPDLVPEPIDLE